jgi:hypothetical protein
MAKKELLLNSFSGTTDPADMENLVEHIEQVLDNYADAMIDTLFQIMNRAGFEK